MYISYKLKPNTLGILLQNFEQNLILENKQHKTQAEFNKHFRNYVGKQNEIGTIKNYQR